MDSQTRRRIDSARDVLVGKVPDPKSQVEQITLALLYKFMDDMDVQAEEWGGQRTFFAGDFAQYRWPNLVRGRLGGHETLNLYAEAIERMPENPGIPPLFRSMFRNAYLPNRDPVTLRLFLNVIDEFRYDHSEDLGDAYEYLLSILSSQGDAGQFRTRRHVIDFMVEVVNPLKNESILDPACGTAGFLISAYKHILRANTDADGRVRLTGPERERLSNNIRGYDISPDMVRLSLANMYLHGFQNPQIVEYDTLSSEERWNEHADVILANPPFMTPKGGIRPHRRFQFESSRSEVLFVDYMATHLTSDGRAGIIVPEGIIFQSSKAYKRLRRMLVDEAYLLAVVSLPAGVFNPYSGVKTSILFLDRQAARRTDQVLFIKISNDGYDLGAQRREIEGSELPWAAGVLQRWREAALSGRTLELEEEDEARALLVPKARLAEQEYNLTAERYRTDSRAYKNTYMMVSIESILNHVKYPEKVLKSSYNKSGRYPIIDQSSQFIAGYTDDPEPLFKVDKPVICFGDHTRVVKYVDFSFVLGADGVKILSPNETVDTKYLYYLLECLEITNLGYSRHYKVLKEIRIPLPPLDVQREIVAEVEGYQRVIDGARQVVESWQPRIAVDPAWPVVKLGDYSELIRGVTYRKSDEVNAGGVKVLRANNIVVGENRLDLSDIKLVSETVGFSSTKKLRRNDIFICLASGSKDHIGKVAFIPSDTEYYFGGFMGAVRVASPNLSAKYLFYQLGDKLFNDYLQNQIAGANINNLSASILMDYQIPLPPLPEQQRIIAEIERERAAVDANRELITLMEARIRAVIDRVWGE